MHGRHHLYFNFRAHGQGPQNLCTSVVVGHFSMEYICSKMQFYFDMI